MLRAMSCRAVLRCVWPYPKQCNGAVVLTSRSAKTPATRFPCRQRGRGELVGAAHPPPPALCRHTAARAPTAPYPGRSGIHRWTTRSPPPVTSRLCFLLNANAFTPLWALNIARSPPALRGRAPMASRPLLPLEASPAPFCPSPAAQPV